MDIKMLIEELNSKKFIQNNLDINEDTFLEGYEDYFTHLVEEGIDEESHRWYTVSTSVYEVSLDKFIGVTHVSDLRSEQSSIEDIFHTLKFFEMTPTTKITYERTN